MDIFELMQNRGTKEVPNPKYNKKTKNREPATIKVPDSMPKDDAALRFALQGMMSEKSIEAKDTEKYRKHGINFSYTAPNLDKQLADTQGAFTKFGNGLAQALVSEVGLGTLRGFSDLIDWIGQGIGASDKDYTNPVSSKLEEWQEKFRNEVAPIYTDPNVNISNGGLLDMGWWASNMPSIMSSLTLLIPSMAATKVISSIGKAARATKLAEGISNTTKNVASWTARATKLDQSKRVQKLANSLNSTRAIETRKAMVESGISGSLSRVMENYQEARQTYTDMYKDASDRLNQMTDTEYAEFLEKNANTIGEDVDTTNRYEVAKAIARKSADETFKLDFANTAFDIWQIYALRNMPFKGFRKQPNRASVNVANKNSIRYAGMTVEEKAAAVAARSKFEKGREHAWNYIKGSANAIGAQASEGIEEAVNYIAQQEGMNLGHVMLGMEDQSDFWDDRLEKYANAPELWESAFWGLMGGIVFQGLSSSFNRARGAIEGYIDSKKNKYGEEDGKSGEKLEKPTWKELWQAPEVKRRIAEIEARDADFRNYIDNIKAIDEGKNPFDVDEKGVSHDIDKNSKEAELLKEKAYNDMVTKMTLRALDTGNYDMLREFLTSDEVKQALIDKGVMTSEDAAKTQTDVANTMDHIVQLYDENLDALNSMSSAINRQRTNGIDGQTIPVEYLQMIARDNINNQLSLEEIQRQIQSWELTKQQKEEFARRGGALDSSVPYQDIVKLRNLTDALGNLLAQKKALEKDKSELETITGQQKMERINNTIDIVKNMVLDINPDQKRAYFLFALQNASAYEQVAMPDGKSVTNLNYESEDYIAFRQKVVDKDKQILEEYGDDFKDITEAEYEQLTVVEDNFRRADVVLKEAQQTLKDTPNAPESAISKDLIDAYNAIADLQIDEQLLRKELVVNEQQLSHKVTDLHNSMNEARVEAIGKAKENLFTLVDNYGVETVRQALREAFDNRSKSTDSSVLSESDLRLFNDSLDYLRLDKDANANLFGYIDEALQLHEDMKIAERLKNAVKQNQSSDTENAGSNNQSSEGENADTSQQNGSQANNEQQTVPKPLSNNEGVYLNYRLTSDGKLEAVVNLDNSQGRKIVEDNNDLSSDNDNPLYTTEPGVSIIDNNYIIGENPIVEVDENGNITNIITPGKLVLATPENEQVVAEKEEEAVQQPTPSPAPTLQPVTPATPNPTTISPDEAAVASAIPSSTGEVVADVAPIPDVTPKEQVEDAVRKDVLKYVQDAIARKNPINWNLIRDHLKDSHKGKLESEAELNDIIEKSIRTYKQLADRRNIPQVADVVDTVIKASSITENSSSALKQDFDKYVDRLVTKYAKQVAADYIDGKYYISLTDLLRYCNQACDTKEAANMLYAALYDSFKRNKEKYIITELTFEDFVANSKIDNRARTQRLLNTNGTYSINHDGLLRQLIAQKSKDVKDFNDILDNLKVGDKIDYEVNGEHIDFKVNGFRIGYLPIPKVREDGALTQVNDELVTDIIENKDGTISSDLKNLLVSWLDNVEINRKLCKAAFENLSKTEREKIAREFVQLPEVQQAIKDGIIVDNPDADKLLEGLAKIWRFSKQYFGEDEEDTKARRAESIDDWFKYMVAPSFNMVYALEAGQRGTVTLESISEGELIRRDGQEPLPIAKAIGSRHKGQVRIAISKTEGELTVAGQGVSSDGVTKETTVPFRGIAGGIGRSRTILVIPARDGHHGYVHMFPRPIRSMLDNGGSLAPGVAPLVRALQDEIRSITERYSTPEEQCNALEAYFRTLFDARTNANTPLLWGVRVVDFTNGRNGDKLGFVLQYYDRKGEQHDIRVSYRHVQNGTIKPRDNIRLSLVNYVTETVTTEKNGQQVTETRRKSVPTHYDNIEDAIKYLKNAITIGQFNIGISFVESDNDTKVDTRNPLVHRDDNGNFVITANGREFKYKSFNDFIIDNNLVSVNTQPSADGKSNYNHIAQGLNQAATQSLKISVNAPVQNTPVVETEKQGITSTAEVIKKILADRNTTNKGKAIAEAVLGRKASNLRIGKELGDLLPKNVKINNTILSLFPKNIIFVDKELSTPGSPTNALSNSGSKPQTDKATGITIEPGQVVVGREFMAMINGTIAEKQQAVRKLIHEQLHIILGNKNFINPDTKRNRYIEQIESIFNKFKNVVGENDPIFSKYLFSEDEYQTNGKINDAGLEEFLVETLTSEELARKLNEIPSDETFEDTNEKKSLFQVIMEKLAKIFNWPIKKGSLYYEELQALRDVLSSTPTTEATNKEQVKSSSPVERNDAKTETPATSETPVQPVSIEQQEESPFENNPDRRLRDRTRRTSNLIKRSTRTESTPDYTDEMNQIKEEAIANGTFMKAPNGNLTNLNERQWLQVRTEAFKKWFGDWINDSANASKVVDENGEPLVVYHGSNTRNIDVFNPLKSNDGISLFFTDDRNVASSYVDDTNYNVTDNYVIQDIIDGYIVRNEPIDYNDIENAIRTQYEQQELFMYFQHSPFFESQESVDKAKKEIEKDRPFESSDIYKDLLKAKDKINRITGVEENIYSTFLNIKNPLVVDENAIWNNIEYNGKTYNTRELSKLALDEGHDGVIFSDLEDYGKAGVHFMNEIEDYEDPLTRHAQGSKVIIAYNSNQVKSATDNNGEFSTTDNNIRRSSRTEAPSVAATVDRVPLDEQSSLINNIKSGNINISCR